MKGGIYIIKLREKIKNWLLKEEINEFKTAQENLIKTEKLLDTYNNKMEMAIQKVNESQKISDDTRKLMNSICEVGTDVVYKNDNSWAVICIHGKMDYVKFVPMGQADIRTIAQFLKQFEYSNRITDTPMRYAI